MKVNAINTHNFYWYLLINIYDKELGNFHFLGANYMHTIDGFMQSIWWLRQKPHIKYSFYFLTLDLEYENVSKLAGK